MPGPGARPSERELQRPARPLVTLELHILPFQPILRGIYFRSGPAKTTPNSPQSISQGGRIWQVLTSPFLDTLFDRSPFFNAYFRTAFRSREQVGTPVNDFRNMLPERAVDENCPDVFSSHLASARSDPGRSSRRLLRIRESLDPFLPARGRRSQEASRHAAGRASPSLLRGPALRLRRADSRALGDAEFIELVASTHLDAGRESFPIPLQYIMMYGHIEAEDRESLRTCLRLPSISQVCDILF